MAIKIYKPTINSRRHASVASRHDLTDKKPEKALFEIKKSTGGRNNQGKITDSPSRRRRQALLSASSIGIAASTTSRRPVIAIEYDPNRTARIALLSFEKKPKAYILAPDGVKVGDVLLSSKSKIEAKVGKSHAA